jgi:hypothetical protein
MIYQTAANPNLQVVLAWLQPALLAIVGIITAWGIGLAKSRGERAEQKAEHVAEVAAISQAAAEKQSATILNVAVATHTLVNSQHGLALATVYEQALRIAQLTNDPADFAKADEAKKNLADHEAKQHAVDIRDAKDAKDAKG